MSEGVNESEDEDECKWRGELTMFQCLRRAAAEEMEFIRRRPLSSLRYIMLMLIK